MSVLMRTNTWDISESDDDDSKKPEVQCEEQSLETDTADAVICKNEYTDRKCSPLSLPTPKIEPRSDTLVLPPRPTGPGTPSPVKKRRTKEEKEADRLRAEERREAREKQKMAKAKEKEEKRQEQQRRKETAEHMKSLRPENCLKCLTVCIDPAVLQNDVSDSLLGTLLAYEWGFSIEDQQVPHSITWTRELPPLGGASGGCLVEDQMVLAMGLTDFLDMVISVKSTLGTDLEDSGGESVLKPLFEHLNCNPKRAVTVLVAGSHPNNWTQALGGHSMVEMLQAQLGMDDLDIEEVLVNLQLCKNISVLYLAGWQEITDHVCAVTKALSKRPFKLLTERTELPFCVDGSWASGARVERDGSGLREVWCRQIQQLNRVSPAVASTVTAAYASPQLLLQAYQRMETEEERKGLLAHLLVKTEGNERRVGPDISARVYRCLTAQNPQLVLD